MTEQASAPARPRRDRIGISISSPDAATLLDVIQEADAAGVAQLWMTQNPAALDALTIYAAAFGRTERVRLGTSIVPTYPRHPLARAQQAATVCALGPGRLRLGVGASHRPAIERTYGLAMEAPLAHLREYVAVLRGALWEGQVDHHGRFFTAVAALSQAPRPPILIAALGAGASIWLVSSPTGASPGTARPTTCSVWRCPRYEAGRWRRAGQRRRWSPTAG